MAPAAPSLEEPNGNPFVNLVDVGANGSSPPPENNSPTIPSSGDPCVDFFFQVVPDTAAETINCLLTAAWDQDPLTALKLVCHLCGVRGTGKSDRRGFYTSALWLYEHHPKTLAHNAVPIAGFGYLKNLPGILHRLVAVPDTRTNHNGPRSGKNRRKRKKLGTMQMRIAAEVAKLEIQAKELAALRREKQDIMMVKEDFRLLYEKTSALFAYLLSSDLKKLKSGDTEHLSLAAKWCPFPNSPYDRSTLLCKDIAYRLFPREPYSEYMATEEQDYEKLVNRLRMDVLDPLRRRLHLPEVCMNSGLWRELKYSCVSSGDMMNHKKLFLKHDAKRFLKFLDEVKKGKAKIAAGALLPHQVLAAVREAEYDEVAELQWKRIVSDLSEKGMLGNSIAVCDVSRRMTGTQMEVCMALGLLISELSEEPWNGRLITFSEEPQVHHIEGETLKQKAKFIGKINRGMNTNFQRVFDVILKFAVERKLEAEKMIKRVFVFSDMEFDQETNLEVIRRKFVESGYEFVVPEIVFWKVKDSRSTPVLSGQEGVALVSGFSKNLIKLFLEGDEVVLSPKDVMEAAIAGEEYKELQVLD